MFIIQFINLYFFFFQEEIYGNQKKKENVFIVNVK